MSVCICENESLEVKGIVFQISMHIVVLFIHVTMDRISYYIYI